MREQNFLSDEKGTITVITCIIALVIILIMVLMFEVGRIMVAKERLQTAADAASFASARMEGLRMVEVEVTSYGRQHRYPVCVSDGDGGCYIVCVISSLPDEIRTMTGPENQVLEGANPLWMNLIVPGIDSCGNSDMYTGERVKILRRWIEYQNTDKQSEHWFRLNLREDKYLQNAKIDRKYTPDVGQAGYPSVLLYASADVPSLKIIDFMPNDWKVGVASQSSTFFQRLANEYSWKGFGKRNQGQDNSYLNTIQHRPEDITWHSSYPAPNSDYYQ